MSESERLGAMYLRLTGVTGVSMNEADAEVAVEIAAVVGRVTKRVMRKPR